MKILKASEAKDLANKFHMKQTEETSKLIKIHLNKVFNNCIKTVAKSGKSEASVNDIVLVFESTLKQDSLNRALIAENVKSIAVLNDYKVQNERIYW